MKKIILVGFLMTNSLVTTICQTTKEIPFEISDIEKGFASIDHLRAVLLEHDFVFEQKDDGNMLEKWSLYKGGVKDLANEWIEIQIMLTFNPDKKIIVLTFRNKIFPGSAESFLDTVKKHYTDKSLEPRYEIKDSKNAEQKGYILIYKRKDSPVSVAFDKNEKNDYIFSFSTPSKKSIHE